jgi:transcription elongation factor Elf1
MTDPRCPQCGATHGDDCGTNLFGELVTLCGHCGTQYETAANPEPEREESSGKTVVPFYVFRCPFCRSKDNYVNGSPLPVRFHRCRSCKRSFQSVEQEAPEMVH